MIPFDVMLQKIRENPSRYGMGGHCMNKKSLKALMMFLNGYKLRCQQEIWEKETGLDYFEHFDLEKYWTLPKPANYKDDIYGSMGAWVEFLYFVNDYYNGLATTENMLPLMTVDAVENIIRLSNSDEESFDTFFELYFSYHKEKENLGADFMNQYQKKYEESWHKHVKNPLPRPNNPDK